MIERDFTQAQWYGPSSASVQSLIVSPAVITLQSVINLDLGPSSDWIYVKQAADLTPGKPFLGDGQEQEGCAMSYGDGLTWTGCNVQCAMGVMCTNLDQPKYHSMNVGRSDDLRSPVSVFNESMTTVLVTTAASAC